MIFEIVLLAVVMWIGFGFLDVLFHGDFMHRSQRNGWCAALASTYYVIVEPESWVVAIASYFLIFVFVDLVGYNINSRSE